MSTQTKFPKIQVRGRKILHSSKGQRVMQGFGGGAPEGRLATNDESGATDSQSMATTTTTRLAFLP